MTPHASEVLVVEDDLPTREMCVFLLSQAGLRVRAAHNGRQALDLCLEELPALVLTDLRLPGLDGYELARELHTAFGEATPPVIAITGFVPADDDLRLEQARFHRLLVKPVAPKLLVDAVKEAISMANVKVPSNPTQQPGRQAGQDPQQGNKREPGSPQQPDYSGHKDKEELGGKAPKH
ncbi:MAG: response regulator [Vicinamibacterales bacterium]